MSSPRPQSSNFYERLGVDSRATQEDIRKAYKKLALKWHPDKNPNRRDEATIYFRRLAEAYDCLSNPQKRQHFDRYGRSPGHSDLDSRPDTGNNHTRVRMPHRGSLLFTQDPFQFENFGFFDHNFDFTFDRAQKIFEAAFGSDVFGARFGRRGFLSSFDDDFLGGFGNMDVPKIQGFSNSMFDFGAMQDPGSGISVQSTSMHRTFSSDGHVSTTQTVQCVNGKKTTRIEKSYKGPDGRIETMVSEHAEEIEDPARLTADRRSSQQRELPTSATRGGMASSVNLWGDGHFGSSRNGCWPEENSRRSRRSHQQLLNGEDSHATIRRANSRPWDSVARR